MSAFDALTPDQKLLIPPETLLTYGPGTLDGFIHGGIGYLHNVLLPRAWLKPEHAILDMGSSSGAHARVLTEFLSPEGRYCGFDVLPDLVKWCQETYARFPNFRFDFADLRSDWYNADSKTEAEDYKFPYADNSFDVAFAVSLFTHLEPAATQNYLRETMRVLKPGGRLLFTCFMVNEHNCGHHRIDVQGRRFSRVSPVHHVLSTEHHSQGVAYDESALRRMVASAGLVIAEMTFGTWSNVIDLIGGMQDGILAMKPL